MTNKEKNKKNRKILKKVLTIQKSDDILISVQERGQKRTLKIKQ